MRRTYLELVGVQVTHSKPSKVYSINNVYVRRVGKVYKGVATMQGYDMTLHTRFTDIVQSIMNAYTPVIKSVWQQDNRRSNSFYLQFVVAFRPEKVGLVGQWKHWAEW